jgi:hypothetical protein
VVRDRCGRLGRPGWYRGLYEEDGSTEQIRLPSFSLSMVASPSNTVPLRQGILSLRACCYPPNSSRE